MKPEKGRNKDAVKDCTDANVPTATCKPATPVNPNLTDAS